MPGARPSLPVLALWALALAPSARAAFEGAIDMRIRMDGGEGTMALRVGPAGTRLDLDMAVAGLPEPLRFALLLDTAAPKRAWLLNRAARTYSPLDLDAAAKAGAREQGPPYAVRELGQGKLLGYRCTHVSLERPGDTMDLWITKEVDVYAVYKRLQEANPQMGGELGLFRALEAHGLQGLPLKSAVARDGSHIEIEVAAVRAGPQPASAFALPPDYRPAESPAPPAAPPPKPPAGARPR